MRFVEIDHIPAKNPNRCKKHVYEMLYQFVGSGAKYAKVILDVGDYTNVESARQSLKEGCERYKVPVKAISRDGMLYLARTDI